MRHFILVKFKDRTDRERLISEAEALFRPMLDWPEVASVRLIPGNSERPNRYDWMIEMTMSPAGLERFDASDIHRDWKATYSDRFEAKTIFDCD